MRTRLVQGTDFTVATSTITIANHAIDTPSIRLLYDETADVLITSTGVKTNVTCSGSVITLVPFDLLNDEGQVIGQYSAFDPNHAYTLAVDYGGGIDTPATDAEIDAMWEDDSFMLNKSKLNIDKLG